MVTWKVNLLVDQLYCRLLRKDIVLLVFEWEGDDKGDDVEGEFEDADVHSDVLERLHSFVIC
jgi:hypothetical protein